MPVAWHCIKNQVCSAPSFVRGMGVGAASACAPASTLFLPSGQIFLSGAEETDLGQEKECLCVASVLASVMGFSSPDYTPIVPSPICAVGEGSEVWTGDWAGQRIPAVPCWESDPEPVYISVPSPASPQPDPHQNQQLLRKEELIYSH